MLSSNRPPIRSTLCSDSSPLPRLPIHVASAITEQNPPHIVTYVVDRHLPSPSWCAPISAMAPVEKWFANVVYTTPDGPGTKSTTTHSGSVRIATTAAPDSLALNAGFTCAPIPEDDSTPSERERILNLPHHQTQIQLILQPHNLCPIPSVLTIHPGPRIPSSRPL